MFKKILDLKTLQKKIETLKKKKKTIILNKLGLPKTLKLCKI